MKKSKLWGASSAIAALALVVSGCSSPDAEDEDKNDTGSSAGAEGGSLNAGWNQPFYSYNEATSNGNATANANIKYMMMSSFWYYTPDLELKRDESFATYEKTSDDPQTVKYTISDDATWSDGTPVDAADMLLTWAAQSGNVNTVKTPKLDETTGAPILTGDQVYFDSSSAGLQLVTKTPEISDDGKSLTLVYDKPFADWELDMAVNTAAHATAMKALGIKDPQEAKDTFVKAVQDKDAAKLGKISNFWNTGYDFTALPKDELLYLSTGPYLLTEMKENQFATLEKNPDYKGDFPGTLDTITVRWNEDPMAQVQALQNGEIDIFSPQVTTDVVKAGEKVQGVEVETGVESTYEHVDLVLDNGGPFDPKTYGGDAEKAKLVRQAFLKAVPRQEMVDKLIKPITPDATTRDSFLMVPGAEGYDEMVAENGMADEYSEPDPAAAKDLLKQAGAKTPIDVRVMYADENVRRANEFELLKPALAQAGFNLIDKKDADWGAKLGDGTYDMVFFGWQSTSTGVSADREIYHTGGLNNLNGYSNPEVDKLFDELIISPPDKQLAIQKQVEEILMQDAIGVTLFQFPSATFWNTSRVEGVDPAVLAPTMFYSFWGWSVPKSK